MKSPAKLPGGWRLFRFSLSDYRRNWWRYLVLIGIVSVPSVLLQLSSTLAADQTFGFYVRLASLMMTAALLWGIVNCADQVLPLRRAYYEGSTIIVRLVILSVVYAAMLMPLVLGVGLYLLGVGGGSTSAVAVDVILGCLAVAMALPTFYWLVRYLPAVYAVALGDWPVVALRRSRRLTQGRFWPVAGRLALLLVWLLLVALVPSAVIILIVALTHFTPLVLMTQLLISLVLVPLALLYGRRLYLALEAAE